MPTLTPVARGAVAALLVFVLARQAGATDYCGPEARRLFSTEKILSTFAPEVEFNRACELHDKCYREAASDVAKYLKQEKARSSSNPTFADLAKRSNVTAKISDEQARCDKRFKDNVGRACERLMPVREAYCKGIDAKVYPWFVRKYGHNWFMRAVEEKYKG